MREAQDFTRLFQRESTEETQLHQLTALRIRPHQLFQRFVDRQQRVRLRLRRHIHVIEIQPFPPAPALHRPPPPRPFDQDPAHRVRGDAEEVVPPIPHDILRHRDPEPDLVHQRGRLQGLVGWFPGHLRSRKATEFRIHHRQQTLRRLLLPAPNRGKGMRQSGKRCRITVHRLRGCGFHRFWRGPVRPHSLYSAGIPAEGAKDQAVSLADDTLHLRLFVSNPACQGGRQRMGASGRLVFAAALSGMGALVLQLNWTRRLAVHLGHELPASLAVLTVFFAGLALGALIFAPAIHRSTSGSRWAGALESVIALWALVSIPLLDLVGSSLTAWTGPQPSALTFATGAGIAAVVSFLPATIAMGATFAALERALFQSGWQGRAGQLYAWNTAGAVLGTGLALFLLQPSLGLRGATLAASGFHALASVLAFASARRGNLPNHPAPPESPTHPAVATPPRWPRVGLAMGGFVGLGTEVLVIRLLAPALGGTVYTQGLVLGIWLTGTAVGAAVWSRWRRPALPRLPVVAAVAAGLSAWAIALALPWLGFLGSRIGHGFAATLVAEGSLVALVLLPITVVGGAWFTAQLETALQHGTPAGQAIGINTLAATSAPVVWGAILFPALHERASWLLLVACLAGFGLCIQPGRRLLLQSLPLAAVALVLAAGPDLRLLQKPPGATLVRAESSASDTVAVWAWPDRHRTLAVNNRFTMGGTASAPAASRHAHIPLLLHPRPRTALFLGIGTGISFAAAGRHPDLRSDGVELVPAIVRAIPEFAPSSTLGPTQRLLTTDARRFIRTTTNTYDVIVSDLFHPDRDGAAWLYTREHFAALRQCLNPGGIACQWLPWFQLDPKSRSAIVQAWLENFPDSQAWLLRWTTLDTPVVGLIHGAGQVQPTDWPSRVPDKPLHDALRTSGLSDGWQLWGCWAGPAHSLIPDGSSIPPNSDDHPLVTWLAPRGADEARMRSARDLLGWLDSVAGLSPNLAGENRTRWKEFRSARDLYLRALADEIGGNRAKADEKLWLSLRSSQDFPTAYSHLLARAIPLMETDRTAARSILTLLRDARPKQPVADALMNRLNARAADQPGSQP